MSTVLFRQLYLSIENLKIKFKLSALFHHIQFSIKTILNILKCSRRIAYRFSIVFLANCGQLKSNTCTYKNGL